MMVCPWCDNEVVFSKEANKLNKNISCDYGEVVCNDVAEWCVANTNLCYNHMIQKVSNLEGGKMFEVTKL